MSSPFDQRPLVVAVTGPNGAGKTTFYHAHLKSAGLRFVNADVLANELEMEPYTAARVAGTLRSALVEQGESFVFETVFSDPVGDKLAFLKDAAARGYTVILCFIDLVSTYPDGNYLSGWQALREARFKRQKGMGIVPAEAELPSHPENLPDWSSLTPEQRDLEDLRMSVYAAMVERMDHGIGRLLDALKHSGKLDNTLILFMSDNGADSFSVADAQMLKQDKLPGDRASNWQPGTGWAYASVTPWRLYKISQHAGGVTTGAIVRWPGKTAKPGGITNSQVHVVDVMPTFLEAAGVNAVATDGESFLPMIQGDSWTRKGPMFFQFLDNRAIRTGAWTMVEVDASGWELFNIAGDPLEISDLAEDHPETITRLEGEWLEWWRNESGKADYIPNSTADSPHYKPQGDRGTGRKYIPSSMPAGLSGRYPIRSGHE